MKEEGTKKRRNDDQHCPTLNLNGYHLSRARNRQFSSLGLSWWTDAYDPEEMGAEKGSFSWSSTSGPYTSGTKVSFLAEMGLDKIDRDPCVPYMPCQLDWWLSAAVRRQIPAVAD